MFPSFLSIFFSLVTSQDYNFNLLTLTFFLAELHVTEFIANFSKSIIGDV